MKSISLYLLLFVALIWAGCGGDETATTQAETPTDAPATEEASRTAPSPTADAAVCLWPEAGLRSGPGRKDVDWITAVKFGEIVTLTGEEETIESEKRTYIEMELADGKKGWSNAYLFAVDAMRAVALSDMELYKRPDLTTFEGKKFEQGDIFAVMAGDREDWVEVVGKERKKLGWIRAEGSNYSTEEIDVTVGILMGRAMAESDPRKREEALKALAENSTFGGSALMKVLDEALAEIPTIPELPANQLYITASNLNVRSAPDNEPEEDNVVFQLNEGDICTIIERGDLVTIREMEDYWYKVSKDGQEGWIFGYFTSKRLSE